MKKYFFAIALLLLSAACGTGNVPPSEAPTAYVSAETSAPQPSQDATPSPETPESYNYGVFTLGANLKDVEKPEPLKVFEAPSCAFEGVDKILYYPGFEVYTYPAGGEDFILSVVFADDGVKTAEGAYLGQTLAEVQALYPDAVLNDNSLTASKGGSELRFVIRDGAVIDITYYYLKSGGNF